MTCGSGETGGAGSGTARNTPSPFPLGKSASATRLVAKADDPGPTDAPATARETPRMKSHVVAALILIVVGTLFLLNNLGYTNVSLTKVLVTWWPAALVAVGLGLLFKRN